jgi:DnaJ-class molecular chaperone
MSNDSREAFEKIFGEEPYLARDAINWQHKLAGWQAAQSRHAAEIERLKKLSAETFNDAINLDADLAKCKAEREALVGLLTVAKCPNCDGSGAVARESIRVAPGCCGRPLASGECCGDPIPVPELSMELEQCQWCYERSVALGLLSDSGSQG